MHIEATKHLYDQLVSFESLGKGGRGYPIHKKLDPRILGFEDIYSWILNRIDIRDGDLILDAGCGVGFGSVRLAKGYLTTVDAISISEKEIEKANAYLLRQSVAGTVNFYVRSFDELEENRKYDRIIAVESLKHSSDIEGTLVHLLTRLNNHGQLIIVEDLYRAPYLTQTAIKYIEAWGLKDAFKRSDYQQLLPEIEVEYLDLTPAVLYRSANRVKAKIILGRLLKILFPRHKLLAIFMGGLWLELLYAKGLMSYQAVIFTKTTTQ